MTQQRRYEVIIVGLGGMGSATLFHLARRGVRALGLDQFRAGHNLGSSHGDSRIIRETFFEHPLYVPLVQRAHELWLALEDASGKALMTVGGGLMIGPADGTVVTGTLGSAREHNLPHEILSSEEVAKRFPAFEIIGDLVAVLDPRAGYLDSERCTKAHIDLAASAGAGAHFNERVQSLDAGRGGVRVVTTTSRYLGGKLGLN